MGGLGMRRQGLGLAAAALWLGLASCSFAPRAVVRNATGSDILLWPLSAQPRPLKAGETSEPITYTARERQEALIERGGCLYTYPAPDYFELPKKMRGYRPAVAVVIREDMSLSLHPRGKDGSEGPEILVADFPLRPTTFCGRRGG